MSRLVHILAVVVLCADFCFVCGDDLPGNAPHVVPARSIIANEMTRRSSHGVECFTCDNCATTSDHTPRKYCPVSPDRTKNRKCIIFSEKFFSVGTQGSWVTRGCASTRGSCEEIKRSYNNSAYNQLEYCKECEGDRCNGAGSLPGLSFAFFAVVVAPILGKCILS